MFTYSVWHPKHFKFWSQSLITCTYHALAHITEQSWSTQNGFPSDEIKLEDVIQPPTDVQVRGAD